MKNKLLFCGVWTFWAMAMQTVVYAQAASEPAGRFTMMDAARFFGLFFLVMGAIFVALLFTNWLGKWREKHKK